MAALPDHLRVTYSIDDVTGRTLATAKELGSLKTRLGETLRNSVASAVPSVERRGLRDWSIGTLPKSVESLQAGHAVRGYPALVDNGDSVGVRLFMTAGEQERSMRTGTRRLLALTIVPPRRALERMLGAEGQLALTHSRCGTLAELIDDCVLCALGALLTAHGGPAWDEESFAKLRDAVRGDLPEAASGIVSEAARIVVGVGQVEDRIDRLTAASIQDAMAEGAVIVGTPETVAKEIQRQVDELGINYMTVGMFFGNLTYEHAMRSLNLFAKEVMPKIKPASGIAAAAE